ncbi:MAG: M61 family metallopeptidase [Burkholderiaceae bacterium]|nr:M61 family metallopeptidase [Burkholderiaceae bacterium]
MKKRNSATGDAVAYTIDAIDPHAHLFEVTLRVPKPAPDGQRFSLPAWIPGSYMIRDFARHIVSIEASSGRRPVGLTKLDKHTWLTSPCKGALELRYRVYAWDLSVRGAHLDATHGFFNGTSVFLCAEGLEHQSCLVEIRRPKGSRFSRWRVATTLTPDGAALWQFGTYRAADYDELIDHPVEIGAFESIGFDAGRARHEIVVTGRHDGDLERFASDLKRICEAQIAMFDPRTRRAPVERYLFLLTVVDDGYGGLEHRSSTALICPRRNLPVRVPQGKASTKASTVRRPSPDDAYQELLGLASHEYFHTWHVKRIRPKAFCDADLAREVHTRLLWVFEGFTSYYDDLMLVRSAVIDRERYLKTLGKTISGVMRGPGRLMQSVAESSFDAWTKFYRQDENAPNAIVSYYAKGALVALALDLEIRRRTDGKRSLDDVMRHMWAAYRAAPHDGIAEGDVPAIVHAATGVDLSDRIRAWADGTDDLPLSRLLHDIGIEMQADADGALPWLGIRQAEAAGGVRITHCLNGSAAQVAGLSAGDLVIAIDGLRTDSVKRLEGLLSRRRAEETVLVHAFRRDELHEFSVVLEPAPKNTVTLSMHAKAGPGPARLRGQWLKMVPSRSGRGRTH